MARSIFAARFAVRITYPQRKGKAGKRDLLKVMPTGASARLYAKRVAARGGKHDLMGGDSWRNGPVACVYDLGNWHEAPECFARRPLPGKHPGYYNLKTARAVRRVPATFARYR